MAKNYGKVGSIYHHDILLSKHHEQDKRKRRMCRCGCRKKVTHIQFCNGVAMNQGCEKSMLDLKKRGDDVKQRVKEKRDKLYKILGIENLINQEKNDA